MVSDNEQILLQNIHVRSILNKLVFPPCTTYDLQIKHCGGDTSYRYKMHKSHFVSSNIDWKLALVTKNNPCLKRLVLIDEG